VLVSILILSNLLIGSDAGDCQTLKLTRFPRAYQLNGEWHVLRTENGDPVRRAGKPVYQQVGKENYLFRYTTGRWAIDDDYEEENNFFMKRGGRKGVQCGGTKKPCKFSGGTGKEVVRCVGAGPLTDASAMMEADAVTEQSPSGLSSGDFMMMAAGAAIGALLVAVAVAVVVAMRKRKSAKRTEMEMTEAVHVPDSSVMTPDATEKKAEGDEEAVTVHSSHVAEVTVSVSMDDEAVQVDAGSVNES